MAQPLTDAITALTRYANEVTGQSDTTLSDAVRTLCDGYGGGRGLITDYLDKRLSGKVEWLASGQMTGVSFKGQAGITEISMPNITSMLSNSDQPFADMQGLETFSAPKVTRVPGYMLLNCRALKHINMSALEDTNTSLFQGCSSIETIVLPSVKALFASTFRYCTGLKKIDVLASTGFTSGANMGGCSVLEDLVIRKDNGVATLSNIANFNDSPFASNGTGGKLYVPQALISAYESATNWSTILGYANNQILPIEGSIYETQYADGTPIE